MAVRERRASRIAICSVFSADPERYAPQFGGFCAGAVFSGFLIPANPESWAIVDGKLYMLAGSQSDIADWRASATSNIARGDRQWAAVVSRRRAQPQYREFYSRAVGPIGGMHSGGVNAPNYKF
jgi:hypothetical protein